jgi:peptide/nickel transport system permease protein
VTLGIYLFSQIGYHTLPYDPTTSGDVPKNLPVSWQHPLGTDPLGRDILSELLLGSITSIHIGILSATVAFSIAVLLALTGGYYGGVFDSIINLTAEVFITLPSLAVLIVVASVVGRITIEVMSLLLAIFSWAMPYKVLKSQTLSLKERNFIMLAKLNGSSGIKIVMKEIMPNMLPLLGAWFLFVLSVTMFAEAGLEIIGLGPQQMVTLGLMFNWCIARTAFSRGIVNWWLPPAIVFVCLFVGIYIITLGLDEIGNPRLKEK